MKDESAQAWTHNALANAYGQTGQPRRAVTLFEMQIAIREKQGDKRNLAIGLENLAMAVQYFIGALREAERNLRRSIDLCREIVDESWEAVGHRELGRVLFYRGKWNDSKQELETAEKLFEKNKNVQSLSVTWSSRALRFLLIARTNPQSKIVNLKSSIECAQRALELADEDARTDAPTPRDYVRAYWLLGSAYRANNELTLAEENLSKALNLCRQINLVEMEADILLDVARLRYAQGDFKDAQEKASEALVITERSGYVLQGADVNLFLAELTLTLDPSPEGRGKARGYAEEAKKLATCDGPPYYYKVAYEEAERMLEGLK